MRMTQEFCGEDQSLKRAELNNSRTDGEGLVARFSRAAGIIAVATVGVFSAVDAKAASVLPGFDLFTTPDATFADGTGNIISFESYHEKIGAALGCANNFFDFGDGNGCVHTGNTDTIVRRIDEANPPNPSQIDIEMVALSLKSTRRVDLFGLGFRERIGARLLQDNGSTMEISFNPGMTAGTWTSVLDFTVEIYGFDSLASTTKNLVFISAAVAWERVILPPAVTILDINYLLNGTDTTQDFFTPVLIEVEHDDGGGNIHRVRTSDQLALVPLPAALPLMLGGFGLLAGWHRFAALMAGAFSALGGFAGRRRPTA